MPFAPTAIPRRAKSPGARIVIPTYNAGTVGFERRSAFPRRMQEQRRAQKRIHEARFRYASALRPRPGSSRDRHAPQPHAIAGEACTKSRRSAKSMRRPAPLATPASMTPHARSEAHAVRRMGQVPLARRRSRSIVCRRRAWSRQPAVRAATPRRSSAGRPAAVSPRSIAAASNDGINIALPEGTSVKRQRRGSSSTPAMKCGAMATLC